jgi:hypothetical protein
LSPMWKFKSVPLMLGTQKGDKSRERNVKKDLS